MAAKSAAGPRSGSPVAPSTRWTSTRQRSTWRRNWWPRPAPSCAPSISPGMSATTKLRSPRQLDHAEVGGERGEGVVGDLGPGPADDADERRLAGVGVADDADVGQQLELELEVLLLARGPVLRVARRLVGRGGEVDVAEAAAPALGDHHARQPGPMSTSSSPVSASRTSVPGGTRSTSVLAADAVHVAAVPLGAALGLVLADVAVVEQRGELGVDLEDHVAAVAAVAAGRAALGDELLPPPGDGAGRRRRRPSRGCGPRRRTSCCSLETTSAAQPGGPRRRERPAERPDGR